MRRAVDGLEPAVDPVIAPAAPARKRLRIDDLLGERSRATARAVHPQPAASRMRVPMSEPDIGAAERAAVLDVLGGTTLALGPWLGRFEHALRTAVGAPHAVAVSSGTAALHLCMLAAGIGPGEVVVTTPFSFVASANCILYVGARPVFVDVEAATFGLDPARLEETLTGLARRGIRARAVIPVHVFGQPADMDGIVEVAERHGLTVIEDACEAIGAEYKGRPVGTLGDAGVFAFYPNKQVTTGEGGMIVTDDAAWDALFRSLRNQGRDVFDGWLEHSRLGFNYRLAELAAAMGTAQIGRLDELLARRSRVAGWYGARLADTPGLRLARLAPATTRPSWFAYVVRLDGPEVRARVQAELERRGIPTRQYFPPIHLQPFYRRELGFRRGMFPVAEAAGDTCLALPFFGGMREQQVDLVCGELRDVLAGARARIGDGGVA